MRLSSGTIDQFIYFVALDSADFTTRETGFSSFTVYSSLNGGAVTTFTTPTINETGSGTMVGVYELLVDENVTITSGNDEEELCIHITHAGMAPVSRTITIYRPKFTEGSTQTNDFDAANDDVAVVTLVGTTTANTDMRGTDSAALASVCTEVRLAELAAANLPTDIAAIPTTAMRGTDSAALASVCTEGRLAELAAGNLPTDIAAIPTTAMRGTDNAALASVIGTVTDLGGGATLADNNADMAGGTFSSATDSLEDIRDRGDAAWTTGSAGTGLTPVASGTAQSATASTIRLASGE